MNDPETMRRITKDEFDKLVEKWKQEERDLLLQLEDHSKGDEQFMLTANTTSDDATQTAEGSPSGDGDNARTDMGEEETPPKPRLPLHHRRA